MMGDPPAKAKVLVVDDDPELVQVISLNLELDGYEVIKAYNGTDAVQLVRETRPDCILLDIMMPVMDGWEVLRHLRENPASMDIPVIIVTARTSDIDKIKGYGGGAQEYITKPFNPLQLKYIIDRVLQPGVREEARRHRAEMIHQLQLATIYDITNALISTLELAEVLDIIVERLLILFELTVCGISLITKDGGRLKFATARSLDPMVEKDIGLFRISLEGLGIESIDKLKKEGGFVKMENPHLVFKEPSPLLSSLESIYIFPLMAKEELIGALTLTKDAPLIFGQEEVDLLYAICNQAAMAIENSRLYEEARRDEEIHRELLHRAITAQESERRRLAAELHDGIIQNLVSALYRQQYAAARLKDAPAEVLQSLAEVREIIDSSISEMRRLIGGLRPPLLDDLGLVKAMERYAFSIDEVADFDLTLELEDDLPALPPEVENSIYRIVQEGLNNMVKHSRCRRGRVRMWVDDDRLKLSIRDDGRGFDPEVSMQPAGSFGLLGIQERADFLKGDLKIETAPGRGTRIYLSMPLETTRKEDR
jgi:signal transduction histidine kinase